MKTRRIITWVTAVFITITPLKVMAQPCPIVRGSIVDKETGEFLVGATVRWAQNKMTGVSTDLNGNFELKVLAGDTLVATFIGYEEQRMIVSINCSIIIRLASSAKDLNEVVIQSERFVAEEFSIKKIKRMEIYTNPNAKADPILAVNSTPSSTTTDESANISLRGSLPAETGIFLNNVPINDAIRYSQLNGIGTFSIFNTALINSVLVYPGNPPLDFGNTTSGLIVLQTDETIPSKQVNTISLTVASMGFYIQRKLSNRSSLTAFSNYQPSLFMRSLNPKSLENVKKFNSLDLGVHYLAKLSDKTIVKIFNYSIGEFYKFYYRHPTYRGNFNQEKIRNFTVANLRHRFRKSEVSFNNGLSFSSAEYTYSITDIDLRLHDFYSSINYQYFGSNGQIKTGLSYDYKTSTFDGKYPLYDFAVGEQYPTDSSHSHQSIKLPELYVYGKYFLATKWILGMGARKNIPIENQKDFWGTQLNLNYKPTKETSINISAGRYNKFQLPQGENTMPFHIYAYQYSFDAKWANSRLESTVSFFYKKSGFSNNKAEVKGIELYTRYRLNEYLQSQLSLTCLDAKQNRFNTDAPYPYDIRYFLRGSIEYKFGGTWTATTAFIFRQGSIYYPVTNSVFDPFLNVYIPIYGDTDRLPSYRLIDVNLSKIFLVKEKISFVAFVGIGNVVNIKNVRGYTYNVDYSLKEEDLFSQRTIFFGFVFNF